MKLSWVFILESVTDFSCEICFFFLSLKCSSFLNGDGQNLMKGAYIHGCTTEIAGGRERSGISFAQK